MEWQMCPVARKGKVFFCHCAVLAGRHSPNKITGFTAEATRNNNKNSCLGRQLTLLRTYRTCDSKQKADCHRHFLSYFHPSIHPSIQLSIHLSVHFSVSNDFASHTFYGFKISTWNLVRSYMKQTAIQNGYALPFFVHSPEFLNFPCYTLAISKGWCYRSLSLQRFQVSLWN